MVGWDDRMAERQNGQWAVWRDVRMAERQDGKMAGLQDGGMEVWQDGRMTVWQHSRITEWQDGKMSGWHNYCTYLTNVTIISMSISVNYSILSFNIQ
jgi:hypothetical protein